ncbi:MAG: hypothetical protein OWU33_01715 [Firmicutes bacterium]|nr:hypothetical protein [Bacillota bacterium]
MQGWQKVGLVMISLVMFTGCSISLGSPSPEHGSTTSSQHSGEQHSGGDPGSHGAEPSLAIQQAVRDELETPRMQKMIAETVSSAQLQQALMTPQGQAILERMVTLVMSSPSVKQQLSMELMSALQSGQMTSAIDHAVKTALVSMASKALGTSSQKSSSSSSSSSSGSSGGQGSGSSSGSGKAT